MVITGKVYRSTRLLGSYTAENFDESMKFYEQLESCLLEICQKLAIPIPIWMKKNTKEFARFRKTFFPADQFMEQVFFDQLVIEIDH